MEYVKPVIERLASSDCGGYHLNAPWATEPVAWAVLALCAHDRPSDAVSRVDWLLNLQQANGSVGIDASQATPGWATSLAVLAWKYAGLNDIYRSRCETAVDRAVAWMLGVEGSVIKDRGALGHDTMIVGWPWVEGTHAWLEPTAMSLLALVHTGHSEHPRAREAVRLLENRILPSGGCNYGNTLVFDQELRPHVQATGLCLLSLANRFDKTGRVGKSIDYLRRTLTPATPTISLTMALQGLAARDAFESADQDLLAVAARRTLGRDASAYKLALIAMASKGIESPLVRGGRVSASVHATRESRNADHC